ncbi:hypothetical protein ITP53_24295 [Nonomuraea sp. K274]|uniref:Uncharacterized protein n=1 Tax=Nonomuraea cypriaca TaxID=1187855 RepID=A0A931F2M4_9ACTN|nr:hypothetical protein [Nonomuraea cypriaca]MBF8188798.1 hypothetical protein [Nonomuraea cypriaca]
MTVGLRLVGVGAMNSPRYHPAGLLVMWPGHHVLLDAGPEAAGLIAHTEVIGPGANHVGLGPEGVGANGEDVGLGADGVGRGTNGEIARLDAKGVGSGADGAASGRDAEGAASGRDAEGASGRDARVGDWLVCDERAELMSRIRLAARALGLTAGVREYRADGVDIVPLPVTHTSHPTYGYLISTPHARAAWAPEFWSFPEWAAETDLMFADAAGWNRPIRFAGGVGGHAGVLQVARDARDHGVRRLIFAHIGRPTIRAIDRLEHPPYGEWGVEGRTYRLTA